MLGRHHRKLRAHGIPPVAGRAAQLVEGWKQLEADLATFEMADAPLIVVGKAPNELPALRIELTGMVTASNFKVFEDRRCPSSTR